MKRILERIFYKYLCPVAWVTLMLLATLFFRQASIFVLERCTPVIKYGISRTYNEKIAAQIKSRKIYFSTGEVCSEHEFTISHGLLLFFIVLPTEFLIFYYPFLLLGKYYDYIETKRKLDLK